MKETMEKLIDKKNLDAAEARSLMESIMDGRVGAATTAALLTALRMKGETVEEITGFAAAMRSRAIPVTPRRDGLVDICGTGGDSRGTFNVSTAAALVTAAMGIPVAKHGNRAVSSRCGSADVLEALGVDIHIGPDRAAALIDGIGIAFLFAPNLHPAMRHAAPVRRELGIRTVFNILGPLTNPAGAGLQLTGVFRADLTETLCRVLKALGSQRAFVVHGLDGVDEVSLSGATRVSALEEGSVTTFTFTPEEAGLERADLAAISGASPEENARYILGILKGGGGPRADAVLLNAGFAAVLAGRAAGPAGGVAMAREAVRSGRAMRLLDALREASHESADRRPPHRAPRPPRRKGRRAQPPDALRHLPSGGKGEERRAPDAPAAAAGKGGKTAGFLDGAVRRKEAETARRKGIRPEERIPPRRRDDAVRDFRGALAGPFPIIAEIKKKSPAVKAFEQAADPARLAAVYEAKGAAAISIVTDEAAFGTSLDDVGPVRRASGLPVLVKDFVIDPYQVLEAWSAGADALLLIVRLLGDGALAALLDRVRGLGMAALVECHDEKDLERAIGAGADIIGVNNRDLATLSVNLDTTRRLAPLVPEGVLCVAESGISSRRRIEELAAAGAGAFLIGGSILSSQDPGGKLASLLGAPRDRRRAGKGKER